MALFIAMFFAGRGAARLWTEQAWNPLMSGEAQNWGLGFGAEGTTPTGNATADELAAYDAYYVGDGQEKVIYLTFDCGFENG